MDLPGTRAVTGTAATFPPVERPQDFESVGVGEANDQIPEDDIEEFHREITGRGYKYLRPGLETAFYDANGLQVIDQFGNRIALQRRPHDARGETRE